jgi:hypothetical protein
MTSASALAPIRNAARLFMLTPFSATAKRCCFNAVSFPAAVAILPPLSQPAAKLS